MRINPEVNENSNLLPEGEYPFEVIQADEKVSYNANDMIVLKLRVGANGSSKIITDYIVAKSIRKVRTVAKACDLLDLLESGEILAEHFVGRTGRVRLGIEKSKNADYPDRNIVVRYVAHR